MGLLQGLCRGYIGILEKKMETTILGLRAWSLGSKNSLKGVKEGIYL